VQAVQTDETETNPDGHVERQVWLGFKENEVIQERQ
jgi:hypothetical protein